MLVSAALPADDPRAHPAAAPSIAQLLQRAQAPRCYCLPQTKLVGSTLWLAMDAHRRRTELGTGEEGVGRMIGELRATHYLE